MTGTAADRPTTGSDTMYTPNLAEAPAPDAATLRRRKNVLYQFGRLIVLAVRMMRVIFRKMD